jgi:hypothetical protein
MLVKVQRSIHTSEPIAQVRVEDEMKRYIYTGDMTPELWKFMGSDFKVFALADLRRKNGKTKYQIKRRCTRQDYTW